MTVNLAAPTPAQIRAAEIVARLERIPTNWWHVRARIYVGIATFFDAFDLLAIASAMPVLAGLWRLTPAQIGYIISAAFVGQIFGAFFFGWFAERFGRLSGLRWSVLVLSLASLACAFSWAFWPLVVSRFIQGIGLGGEVPVSGAYIAEIAKAERRGRFFLLYEMIFGIGIIVAGLIGLWLVPRFGWQAMFVIGALPAMLALVMRRVLPESPRWLLTHGRAAEAEAVVADMEAFAVGRGHILPPPGRATIRPRLQHARLSELFQGIYLRRTLLLWACWFCTFFIVYGSTTWLPAIYRTVFKVDLQTALLLGTANGIGGIIGDLGVAYLIDYLGRRLWYSLAFFLGALPLILLWFLGAPDPITVAVLCTTSYMFLGSNAVSLLLYTGELYPTRMRALGTSIASVWARIASSVAPIVVGMTIVDFDIATVFLMFAGVSLLGAAIAGVFAVETRRRVLEEVSP